AARREPPHRSPRTSDRPAERRAPLRARRIRRRREASMVALDKNRVLVFDTTLRDGEQAPGFSMGAREKVRIAHALKELGVDIIEAGFAAASPGDAEAVRQVAATVTGPV